jgi:S1-C subfamily serine protease
MTAHTIQSLSDELAQLVEAAGAGAVQVSSRHGRPASGTVFAAERVLTSAAAVEGGNTVTVRSAAGEVRNAELAGLDPASGLAVVRVPGLAASPFQQSSNARTGQLALALGRTWSGTLTASAGIVSAIGGPLRTGRGRALEQVIRAEVHVHPLGAGGPLVDVAGHVLGVATGAMLRGQPLFVPASIAWQLAEAIEAHGRIKRGYLGISGQPIQLPERQKGGRAQRGALLVVGVAAGSPAEKAGLLVGDLVVGFAGQPVEEHDGLLALLGGDQVGKAVAVELSRGGELRTLEVVVGER